MEASIKLRIESNDKEITTRVYDDDGVLLGETTGSQSEMFYGSGIYCDTYGADGETLTSIYLPREGHIVTFSFGDKKSVAIDALNTNTVIAVHTLDYEGNPSAVGYYLANLTMEDGELFTLDMRGGVTNDNIGDLAVSGEDLEIIVKIMDTEWELDASGNELSNYGEVILRNIGDTVSIGVTGGTLPELWWGTSDDSVIKVDQNGVVTAIGYGEAQILAMAQGASMKTCAINAKVLLEAESVLFHDVEMIIGERVLIRPIFMPENATVIGVTYEFDENAGIITTRDEINRLEGITSISTDSFVIIALAEGVIEVTGTAAGGASGSFKVTVLG